MRASSSSDRAGHLFAVERNRAVVGRVEACDEIEERRLPQPDGPITATNSPRAIVRFRRAQRSGQARFSASNVLRTPRTTSTSSLTIALPT